MHSALYSQGYLSHSHTQDTTATYVLCEDKAHKEFCNTVCDLPRDDSCGPQEVYIGRSPTG